MTDKIIKIRDKRTGEEFNAIILDYGKFKYFVSGEYYTNKQLNERFEIITNKN